jgi:hypothetical protein
MGLSGTSKIFITLFLSLTISTMLIVAFLDFKSMSDNNTMTDQYWYGTNNSYSFSNDKFSNQTSGTISVNQTVCSPGDWICGIVTVSNSIVSFISMIGGIFIQIGGIIIDTSGTPEFPLWANVLFIKSQVVGLIISGIFLARGD